MAQRGARKHEPVPAEVEAVAKEVVDAACAVHVALGPGLLESVYEQCLCHELGMRQMTCQRQVKLPIVYRGLTLDRGLRLDLLVENAVICELKAVDKMPQVAIAQMLTYLNLADKRLGFLINFNVRRIKDGIQRVIL